MPPVRPLLWGLCATVKAPADQVLAFAAHHLAIGCATLWLCFDDPDDPAADAVAGIPGVTAIRCTDAHWRATAGRRPSRHQNRQSRNMQAVYATCPLPFLGHIDVDEVLWPDPALPGDAVGTILAALPPDQPMLRLAPWEALHDASLPPDIPTARHFRAAMKGQGHAALRDAAFGPYAPLLPEGVLSHSAGKCLFRTGLSRFEPRLHGAFRAGVRVPGPPFDPRVALLHFHAQDRDAWLARLPYRLEHGAYQYNPALQAHLQAASPEEIADFYTRTQQATPETLAALQGAGLLIEADLRFAARVAALRPPAPPPVLDRR